MLTVFYGQETHLGKGTDKLLIYCEISVTKIVLLAKMDGEPSSSGWISYEATNIAPPLQKWSVG